MIYIPDSLSDAPLQLSQDVVNDMIQNISSPVEMANQIKKSGAPFSQQILNSSDKTKDYNTSFKRALNLGVYSADLGYINFAQFLCNLNTALGNIYTYIYFPNISNPATTLKYKFRMSNYATANENNTTYEIATYYDILEDICKLFGWQAIEMGE